jgi:hypothetical protein
LVAKGLAQDGQDPPVAGQVASLTTTNNLSVFFAFSMVECLVNRAPDFLSFTSIDFCKGQTITNGQQLKDGSCNPVPMGDIIPQANMPSSKFTNPKNFSTIKANQGFTISIAVQNMDTGFFTNAQKKYVCF